MDGVLSSLVDLVSITSKGHGQGGTSSCLAVLSTIRLLVWNTAASKALVDAFGLPAMTAIMAGNFPAELRLLSAKVVWRVVSLMPDGAAALPVVEDIANTMADGSLGATQVSGPGPARIDPEAVPPLGRLAPAPANEFLPARCRRDFTSFRLDFSCSPFLGLITAWLC